MKYFELEKEELETLQDYESGDLVPVNNMAKEKRLYESYAKNTLEKTKNINIRLSDKVLHKLKVKAAEQGIPYQTLAASVLHRFANN